MALNEYFQQYVHEVRTKSTVHLGIDSNSHLLRTEMVLVLWNFVADYYLDIINLAWNVNIVYDFRPFYISSSF